MPIDISSGMIPLDQIPEYQRSIAVKQRLVQGNLPGSIAHAQDNNQIAVDMPSHFTGSVAAHELTHQIQKAAGSSNPVNTQQAVGNRSTWDSIYGYGGAPGLAARTAQGKNINSLNDEQQAEIPRQYMDEYQKAVAAKNPQAVDRLNAAYSRPLQQLQNMAAPGINTTPAPPAAPPAVLTGIAVPVPGMLSSQTKSAPLTPFQHLGLAAGVLHNLVKQ